MLVPIILAIVGLALGGTGGYFYRKNEVANKNEKEAKQFIKSNRKGIYCRKIWFYYEFFKDVKLELDDLPAGKYENLINEKEYFTNSKIIKSKRHKINNNLLGNPLLVRSFIEFSNTAVQVNTFRRLKNFVFILG